MSKAKRASAHQTPWFTAGLQASVKVTGLNDAHGPGEYNPRPLRGEVNMPAVVVVFGRPAIEVMIRNVSKAGLCVETTELLPISSQAIIVIEVAGAFPAQVRWALGRHAGFFFNGKISDGAAQFLAANLGE